MIDTAKITVCGGNGGDGLITFAKARLKPKGPPMGGSGGSGGDVYLAVDTNVATLKDFVSTKMFKAPNGVAGGSNDKTGKCAEDLFIRVPIGTTVKDSSGRIIADLNNYKSTVLVAKGGAGGHGNAHMAKFKAPNFTPSNENGTHLIEYAGKRFSKEKHIYYAEKGRAGETFELKLELKLIADVGLVGLPNAGKSSLLNALTKTTKALIGSYPFTTLEPNLGVIFTDSYDTGTRIVLADIPGLIEGAHEGKGLGDRFLKHVERTKVLVHVIDIENLPEEAKSATKTVAYNTVREELYKWNRCLIEKPEIIVINKTDTVEDITNFKKHIRNVIFTSALSEEGILDLKEAIIREVVKQREKENLEKKKEDTTPKFTIETLPNRKMVFPTLENSSK